MVRSLALWTKTLSFPARNTPSKRSKGKNSNSSIIMPSTPTKDRTPLSTPDVSDSEKDIMASTVYCIHHKEGCKWSDQLKKLKGHLQTCKYDTIPCSNKCGAQIPRILMEDHLKYTCSERLAHCEFCGQDFIGIAMEDHNGYCPLEPMFCEYKCGQKLQRRYLSRHKINDCCKRTVSCRYCSSQYVADTLQTHHTKCPRVPVPCPNRCELMVVAREDMETHLKEHCNLLLSCCAFKEAGCRFKGLRGPSMDRHMEEAVQQHLLLMCSLVSKQQNQISTLKNALSRLSLCASGTLVWKISEYSVKFEEARGKDGIELISSPFYTSQFGYKLQASVFLNGNGAGENTHISVYIKILPGEYDALLKWPFSHTVSFTLFDQSEKPCNIVESFVPDPTWENFQRPSKAPDSLGFGFPKFISHEILKKRQFVKDDTLFIRIKVDPSKIIAV